MVRSTAKAIGAVLSPYSAHANRLPSNTHHTRWGVRATRSEALGVANIQPDGYSMSSKQFFPKLGCSHKNHGTRCEGDDEVVPMATACAHTSSVSPSKRPASGCGWSPRPWLHATRLTNQGQVSAHRHINAPGLWGVDDERRQRGDEGANHHHRALLVAPGVRVHDRRHRQAGGEMSDHHEEVLVVEAALRRALRGHPSATGSAGCEAGSAGCFEAREQSQQRR